LNGIDDEDIADIDTDQEGTVVDILPKDVIAEGTHQDAATEEHIAVDTHPGDATEELTGDTVADILPGDATLGDTPHAAGILPEGGICLIAEAATCFIFKNF
jgi:hypothetical protein